MNQPLKQGSYTRTYGAEAGRVWPRFFLDTVEDAAASAVAGRPIYRDIERVELNFPGDPNKKPVRNIRPEDQTRWPEEYGAFKRGQDVALSGTPIDHLPMLKPSMVRELKAIEIMTIEQLAALSDHGLQRIPMFGRQLKERAQAYLDSAAESAQLIEAQERENRHLAKIADLELRMENMSRQFNEFMARAMDRLDAPNPMMTHVPAQSDPMEQLRQGHKIEVGQSSFADLPPPPPPRKKTTQKTEAPAGEKGS